MSFKNMRALEEKDPINTKEYFFRQGTSGSGRQELSPSTLDKISSKASGYIKKARGILTEQGIPPE
jgi:hypothetical protein